MFVDGIVNLFSNPLWLMIHLIVIVVLIVWIVYLYKRK